MNLSRVLDVSLPDLPKIDDRERFFRFNPKLIWRQQTEKGVTSFLAITPETRNVFMFTPEKWQLVQLFNGKRNYEEISRLWQQKTGVVASAAAIRGFAETLDAGTFWLRTPEEEALAIMEELKQRQNKARKKALPDLTKIYVFTVDEDKLITKVHRYVRFMFTTPFVLASIVGLLLMLAAWVSRWNEVWTDSATYWSMAGKNGWDVLEFYIIFAFVGFFHEWGHALTAKNFGAEVHRVGLMLVYTIPAFFVETTEAVVHANYFQRMYVILAGFWFELILCSIATFVWRGTAVGGFAHNLAYKIILVGGIMPILFNMNPLMRLDGYLLFSKMVRQPFLKEKSTAFLSAWVQSRIFRLKAYVEPLPTRRAIFFATYAFLSGVYTYFVLLFLARITYRTALLVSPDWAFVPACLVALSIFRSRLEKFAKFLRTLYERHKENLMTHRYKILTASAVALLFLILPLWRETVDAPVILEPRQEVSLAAHVSGRIEDVFVAEGQTVTPGTPVAMMSALRVEGEQALAHSELQVAEANARQSQLTYSGYANAQAAVNSAVERFRVASDKSGRLAIVSTISGVVASPRIQDLRGSFVSEGTKIADVQDISTMKARIYVDESDMRTLTALTSVRVKLDSRFRSLPGEVESVSSKPEEPSAGVVDTAKYKGLRPPPQYCVSVLLPNDGGLRAGMTGQAKLFGQRESLIGKAWRPIADFVGRKIW